MSNNIENNDKPHTAPVIKNLSPSIIGGGALGALCALIGIVFGFIVESSVSVLIIAAAGIVGGLVSLLMNHQSDKKVYLESALENIVAKELPYAESTDSENIVSEEFSTEYSTDTLKDKISQILELIQSKNDFDTANYIDNSNDGYDNPHGLNSINQFHLDEVITKLELARVYVEMEDIENARILFDEVIEETEEFKVIKATNQKESHDAFQF